MLSMKDLSITESVYTFVEHSGKPTHIAAGSLLAAVKRSGALPMLGLFGEGLTAALERGDLGVEEDHALTLPEAALDVPVLVCAWGTDHIVADGAHRLWRRWKRGDDDFPMYYLPEAAWRLFVIEDMPGSGEFWKTFNRNAKVRTPDVETMVAFLRNVFREP